jgi:hypothetical protein
VEFKMSTKENGEFKTAWVSKGSSVYEKPWGYETRWTGFAGIHGKTLFMHAGCRTSLKYNSRKTEVLMLKSGEAEVTFGNENTVENQDLYPYKTEILSPGESLLVQSCCPYRIRAITDCEIFEIGDNAQDMPVRISDDYGRLEK